MKDSINNIVLAKSMDIAFLENVENHLIQSGVHVSLIAEIMNTIIRKVVLKGNGNRQLITHILKEKLINMMKAYANPIDIDPDNLPQVIFICGVNGSGKTSAIGKMVHMLSSLGWRTVIAACDTFRSAADEQLALSTMANGAEVIFRNHPDEPPARIASRAYQYALENEIDILIIDTSGRLHNNSNLMLELKKIKQKLSEQSKSIPHNIALILDANAGYGIIDQVDAYHKAIGLTGFILTKTDIAKRPGSIISVCKKFKLPIYGVSDGESKESIQSFDPVKFAESMISGINGNKE